MLFSEDHIIPRLRATDKPGIIRELVRHLVSLGHIAREDEARVLERVFLKDKFNVTAFYALATPFCYADRPGEGMMAIGVCPSGVKWGVEWDAPISETVRVVLLVIVGTGICHNRDMLWAGRMRDLLSSAAAQEATIRSDSQQAIWSLVQPCYEARASLLDATGAVIALGEACVRAKDGRAYFYPDGAVSTAMAKTLVTAYGGRHLVAPGPERPAHLGQEFILQPAEA